MSKTNCGHKQKNKFPVEFSDGRRLKFETVERNIQTNHNKVLIQLICIVLMYLKRSGTRAQVRRSKNNSTFNFLFSHFVFIRPFYSSVSISDIRAFIYIIHTEKLCAISLGNARNNQNGEQKNTNSCRIKRNASETIMISFLSFFFFFICRHLFPIEHLLLNRIN